ncbi:NAD-dependent epimerase/dehydratase family protein [Pseudonocardia sp. TRM90224]|uniref:NAD-dependent epimerase/dehydratase family protein n=1 Tax=Pseudonocardia sp. TRM90224 TaxID=2812678 RepID=UPI001E43BB9E|nr:NAD(P)-dependent oxidoreductase [Pseudonocardia sp. TRM90224]
MALSGTWAGTSARGRLLVTGSAGLVGRQLRPLLARPGRVLRLLDVAEQEPGVGVELVTASITDEAAMAAACAGVDAVLHLGGQSTEGPWERVVELNITGTRVVLDAAHAAGVRRVVLASSHHVVGSMTIGSCIPAAAPPCPDSFYGVSKAAVEALGRLYHERFGMDVVCVRFGSVKPVPDDVRGLITWQSSADAARLVEACLAASRPGFRIVWGVSANTRGVFSLDEGRALGYHPRDDSEAYAALVREGPEPTRVGGEFLTRPLGADRRQRRNGCC